MFPEVKYFVDVLYLYIYLTGGEISLSVRELRSDVTKTDGSRN